MTANSKSFKAIFDRARKTLTYAVEGVILEFTEEIVARMESENVSNAELAKRLDASPAYVTKILRGSTNFTLETMVKIARALNAELRVHLQPAGSVTQWFDLRETVEKAVGEQPAVANWQELLGHFAAFTCAASIEKPAAPSRRMEAARGIRPQASATLNVEAANEEFALTA